LDGSENGMNNITGDNADCGDITQLLQQMGEYLDRYQLFEHGDAMHRFDEWSGKLGQPLPLYGVGIRKLVEEIGTILIPNASQIPNPGCTSFITTGATNAGVLASLAGNVASPQRIGLTAFNFLEELSLQWLADMFELPKSMKGVYSSGGSVANLLALGAARQWAFERRGMDPAKSGINRPCRLYGSKACHHTIHRAAAVLGMGRDSVVTIESDENGRIRPSALMKQLHLDQRQDWVPVAVIANAGTTGTGAIDPLRQVGQLAREYNIWFHIDGAYGLPGILDPDVHHLYDGLDLADSVIVDPHKWLGAPVGVGATFVRDRSILLRAFTQQASDYLEGSFSNNKAENSMDKSGIPYYDFGVELSAPSRGAIVWALIREIGKQGMQQRIRRHNAMARYVADKARSHQNLEVLQEPTLSIACIRYIHKDWSDLNYLNELIHRQMVRDAISIPSTTSINGNLAIRPCFVGARTDWKQADELISEVIRIGDEIVSRVSPIAQYCLV